MKGISPLIAAVLLIAFTVAVGGIIAVWVTSFTKTTTTNVGVSTRGATACQGARFDFVTWNNNTKIALIKYSGGGGTKGYIISLADDNGNVCNLKTITPLANSEILRIDIAQNCTGTLAPSERVVVTGNCTASSGGGQGIEGKCEATDPDCWVS